MNNPELDDPYLAVRNLVRSDLSISPDQFRRGVVVHFGLRPFTLDHAATLFCLLLLERQGLAYRIGRDCAGNTLWRATGRARNVRDMKRSDGVRVRRP